VVDDARSRRTTPRASPSGATTANELLAAPELAILGALDPLLELSNSPSSRSIPEHRRRAVSAASRRSAGLARRAIARAQRTPRQRHDRIAPLCSPRFTSDTDDDLAFLSGVVVLSLLVSDR